MTGAPLQGVSATALAVARVRAHETTRPDRLFDDPYAGAFAAAAPPVDRADDPPERAEVRRALAFQVVVRTKFYDDYLLAAVAAGCRQVVLLAAGLDTRAFRLPWPAGTRVWEVDLPDVQQVKAAVLTERGATPRCERRVVATDLREPWSGRLVDEGLDPAAPTAWLAEGLLVYLSAAEAAHVLEEATATSAAGSRLAFEQGAGGAALRAAHPGDEVISLWQGGLDGDPAEWLAARGWQVETHELAQVAAAYGRPAPRPTRTGFLTADYTPSGT